jgi:hypothetical protein
VYDIGNIMDGTGFVHALQRELSSSGTRVVYLHLLDEFVLSARISDMSMYRVYIALSFHVDRQNEVTLTTIAMQPCTRLGVSSGILPKCTEFPPSDKLVPCASILSLYFII